ncbi:MAG: DUF1080 domain-containing protein [Planctomycetota bacterium]
MLEHSLSVVVCRCRLLLAGAWIAAAVAASAGAESVEYLSGVEWPEPAAVTPGATPGAAPSDATVLFDGTNLDAWENGDAWKVEGGVATVGTGPITTKQTFGDCQLHVEWSAPVSPSGDGQNRGNSGVFFLGHSIDISYEVQVLDSFQSKTYFDGQAGAVYKQTPPMVNVTRPPGEWNVYDILWTAPRFEGDGTLKSPAYVTVLHNGVVVQNHFQLKGSTYWHRPPEYVAHEGDGLHISLQDHHHPVRYRNIWVREWKALEGKQAEPPSYYDHATGKTSAERPATGG